MTIDEVYQFVQFIANKDQRGFIKPSEFNLAAERAQLDFIEDRFQGKSTHKNLDDLRTVIERVNLSYAAGTNGAWVYPTDMLHYVSMTHGGNKVDLVSQEKLEDRVNSQLVAPTASYPLAVMIDEGFEIYDSATEATAGTVALTYIKIPAAPVWTYVLVNGMYVFDGSSSSLQQLTLPESTHLDVSNRILGYLGVSLREADLAKYSELKTTEVKES